jgi:uncharacterized Zn finger protein
MAITTEWLKQASSTQSYSKGKDYINDVDDLVKHGNTYTAVVLGSEEYEVMINDTGITPHAECDCPYDHGGICKHIVAVGLNIIKGNFETEDEEDEDTIVNDVASTKGYANACANLKPLKKLPKSHQMDLKTYLESLRSRF